MKKVNYVRIIAIILCIIGALKILLVGYDIDEEYALAMSYRMTQGDFLVYNMWEPHQTSGFLMAFLMAPYLMIVKTTTGIALYVRICGLILHTLIHRFLYKTLCSYMQRDHGLLVCSISFFALPKLMFLPEFANMQMWFMLLIAMCLLKYYGTDKLEKHRGSIRWLILAGCFTALEVLTYPSTFFSFVGIVVFIFWYKREKTLCKELFAYIMPCIIMGTIFLCILLTKIPLSDLGFLIRQVTNDGSHVTTLPEWLERHSVSALKAMSFLVVYAIIATCVFGIFYRIKIKTKCSILWIKIWIAIILLGQVCIWIFGNYYPNYPSVEYFAILIIYVFAIISKKVKNTPIFAFLTVVPFLSFPGILIFSNHPMMVSFPFLGIFVIGVLALPEMREIYERDEDGLKTAGIAKIFSVRIILLMWLIVSVFGKCYMVRTTGGEHYAVFQDVSLFREGVAKGIIANDRTVTHGHLVYHVITEMIPKGSGVFYVGNHSDIYLLNQMEICTPSTISTPTYGENVELYFQLYPEKKPDYIVIDSCFTSIEGAEWLNSFVSENCTDDAHISSGCLTIYTCK